MWDALDPRSSDPREAAPDIREEPVEPQAVAAQGLDLPRGRAREHVVVREQEYALRGSETRALATIGAFRVVPAKDLRDDAGRPGDLSRGDLEHLRREGLVRGVSAAGDDGRLSLVTLTARGRDVLESHRVPEHQPPQTYYADAVKTRELAHDAHLYRAYLRSADRLYAHGARLHRVVLDDELKRDYQQFLQEPNRDRADADGRPARQPDEIAEWAEAHHLPVLDDHVQFPDLQIEYETPDGRWDVENVEILTPHYRGAHATAKARSGFTGYRTGGGRVGGRSGRGSARRRPFDPAAAEEFLK
jgi:hypothetical protein